MIKLDSKPIKITPQPKAIIWWQWESLYCAGLDDHMITVLQGLDLLPSWFLVIWFDLMPSCIPRNLHECTCRGSGSAWAGWAGLPCLRRCRPRLCHLPAKTRQTPRRQTIWPSTRNGAHAHEHCVNETAWDQTRTTGIHMHMHIHTPLFTLKKPVVSSSIALGQTIVISKNLPDFGGRLSEEQLGAASLPASLCHRTRSKATVPLQSHHSGSSHPIPKCVR